MKNNNIYQLFQSKKYKYKRYKATVVAILFSSFGIVESHAGTPFSGAPIPLPGVIEAEDFDLGGMGDSYSDSSMQNIGGAYRPSEAVDIESSSTGGYNLGWLEAGEWVEYSVRVQQEGKFDVSARVASPGGQGRIQYDFSGPISLSTQQVDIPNTGGWQNWENSVSTQIFLTQGEYRLRAYIRQGGFNLDSLSVNRVGSEDGNKLAVYPGYTGNYPGFSLEIDERFNEFNSSLWTKSSNHTFYEPQCIFEEEGVQFNNGIMELTIDEADNWKGYSCGEIRSKQLFPYGRIEARIKTPSKDDATGYISSLFTYYFEKYPSGDAKIWRELDIEMEGAGVQSDPQRYKKFQANLIFGNDVWEWWRTGYWGRYEDKIVVGETSNWKVYALEWTENYIRWFVDGEIVKELNSNQMRAGASSGNEVPHIHDANVPEYKMGLFMNFWIPNNDIERTFGGVKSGNKYPMKAEYDWFRYYRCTTCGSTVN